LVDQSFWDTTSEAILMALWKQNCIRQRATPSDSWRKIAFTPTMQIAGRVGEIASYQQLTFSFLLVCRIILECFKLTTKPTANCKKESFIQEQKQYRNWSAGH
jgi:hypothetical protein